MMMMMMTYEEVRKTWWWCMEKCWRIKRVLWFKRCIEDL